MDEKSLLFLTNRVIGPPILTLHYHRVFISENLCDLDEKNKVVNHLVMDENVYLVFLDSLMLCFFLSLILCFMVLFNVNFFSLKQASH